MKRHGKAGLAGMQTAHCVDGMQHTVSPSTPSSCGAMQPYVDSAAKRFARATVTRKSIDKVAVSPVPGTLRSPVTAHAPQVARNAVPDLPMNVAIEAVS